MPNQSRVDITILSRQQSDAAVIAKLMAIPISGLYPEDWTVVWDAPAASPPGKSTRSIVFSWVGTTFDQDYPTNALKTSFLSGMLYDAMKAEFPALDGEQTIAPNI